MEKGLVLAPGVFDVLHYTHVKFLQKAKAFAGTGRLVIALNSDASVRKLKGPGRPVFSFRHRRGTLLALRCVDDVVKVDGDSPVDLILKMKPEFVVKGGDWWGRSIPEMNAVQQYGGIVVFIGKDFNNHTTDLIRRLQGDS